MFGLGFGELLAIGVLLFVVFGAKRLPQLGGSLAQGIKNFQKGLKDDDKSKGEIENNKESDSDNKNA